MHGAEPVVCEIKLCALGNEEDQVTTRASWTGQAGATVELNPPRSRYLDVNSALVSVRPRNWGTLADMLLLGSKALALLTGITIHRPGRAPLALHYGVAIRGAAVPATVLTAVTDALSPGNSLRFGLARTHATSSSAPSSIFPGWKITPPTSRPKPSTEYPWLRDALAGFPELWSSPTARKACASEFARSTGVFMGCAAAAEKFLYAVALENAPAAASHRQELKQAAASQASAIFKPLKKGAGILAQAKQKGKRCTALDDAMMPEVKRFKK